MDIISSYYGFERLNRRTLFISYLNLVVRHFEKNRVILITSSSTRLMPQPTDQPNQLPSLSDLFAESDRIGDKYLTDEEIETRDRDLGQEINAGAAVIEALFPGL